MKGRCSILQQTTGFRRTPRTILQLKQYSQISEGFIVCTKEIEWGKDTTSGIISADQTKLWGNKAEGVWGKGKGDPKICRYGEQSKNVWEEQGARACVLDPIVWRWERVRHGE